MTSNMGSHIIQENFEGMNEGNKDKILSKTRLEVFELLKKSIRPEFLNRIDETIMFTPLSREDVKQIVKIQFGLLAKTLAENNIKIEATEEAIDWLAQLGYDPQFGARPVKRVLQKRVVNELSKQILAGKVHADSEIMLDVFDGEFVFRGKIEKELKKQKIK